ncbi:MAG: hypothetical protein KDD62_02315 [Bdellovibrionales bacterium]|nr:hypothetical protein [Bdellovibrionales bacterium]
MKHYEVDEIACFFEGSLDALEGEALERHLEVCLPCQSKAHEWKQLQKLFLEESDVEFSEAFVGNVMSRIGVADAIVPQSGVIGFIKEWMLQSIGLTLACLLFLSQPNTQTIDTDTALVSSWTSSWSDQSMFAEDLAMSTIFNVDGVLNE